jgi:Uma2 family endonuclease
MSVPAALKFTYEDYALLPEDQRCEVIDGEPFLTPAPTPNHQAVLLRLARAVEDFVEARSLGRVFIAPCDVVLSKFDILQPDVFFIAADQMSLIGEKYIAGAPDLVIEVLSPSTQTRDRVAKAKRYAAFGVREMWLVDTAAKTIEVLVNTGDGFQTVAVHGEGHSVHSTVLLGLDFPAGPVFRPVRG